MDRGQYGLRDVRKPDDHLRAVPGGPGSITRALFTQADQELLDVELPREFRWAEGHGSSGAWETSDFSALIDHKQHWRAFGVRFALDDLLKLILFEQYSAIRRQPSAAGNFA